MWTCTGIPSRVQAEANPLKGLYVILCLQTKKRRRSSCQGTARSPALSVLASLALTPMQAADSVIYAAQIYCCRSTDCPSIASDLPWMPSWKAFSTSIHEPATCNAPACSVRDELLFVQAEAMAEVAALASAAHKLELEAGAELHVAEAPLEPHTTCEPLCDCVARALLVCVCQHLVAEKG